MRTSRGGSSPGEQAPKPHIPPEWRTDWLRFAACGKVDPELFYPDGALNSPSRIRQEAMALSICNRCSVMLECRAEGDVIEQGTYYWGVRGGETERERRSRRSRDRRLDLLKAAR